MSFKRPYFKNNKVDYGEIISAGKNANINLLKQKSNESGIPVNIADENNNNLFHLALMNSSIKSESKIINFFKYLLSENTSPGMMNIDGMTPLHIACKRQSKKVVNYLLKIGCDINSIDNKGLYPIDYLLKGKYKMFKKEKSITDLYKIELKKELVNDSLIDDIYDKYKINKISNDKLKFDIIKDFINNSLLNDCSRELYIIYKSDIGNKSVIRENIKAIQTKIVDKLLKLDDIKSIDNFESLKKITFVGGAVSANPKKDYNNAKNEYNNRKSIYEEFKKKKEFTDLFNEIFDPKFVYDDKKTELFDTLFEIKKKGNNSRFVYSDTKDDNKLILYGILATVPSGPRPLRNLNGDLHNDIKKLETLKKNINANLFYISHDEVNNIALNINVLAAGDVLENGPEIQLVNLDIHPERKKKYTKFKNTYLKKVKEVLENYISKVDKVGRLYEIAKSFGYINDATLKDAEQKFINIKGVARNIINFVKIAELYNPEENKQNDKNINDKFKYVIEDNYASLSPFGLNTNTNEIYYIRGNFKYRYRNISDIYNKSTNYKLAALECKDKKNKCIDYLSYDQNKLKTFYNALMLLESRQTTHISFWKKLKDFFNNQLNSTINDHFKDIKRQIDSKEDMLEPLVEAKLALDKAKDQYIKTLKQKIKNKDSDTITQVNLIDLLNKINIKSVDKYLEKSTMFSSKEIKGDDYTHHYKIYYKDNNLVIKYDKYDRTEKIVEDITKKTGGAAPAPAPLDINDILDNITIDTIYNSMLMRSSNKIILFENIDYKDDDIFDKILSVKNPTPELKDKLDSYKNEYNNNISIGNTKKTIKQLYNWCSDMKEYYDNNKNNMVCNKLFVDTINYLKLKKLDRLKFVIYYGYNINKLDYTNFLLELAKSRIINDGDVNRNMDKLLTLAYADDIDMINFLRIPDFKYIYEAPYLFSEETLKDSYEKQLNCLLHDSLYKILNDTTNIEKINNRVDVYKKDIENEINEHNSDQYDEYMNKSSSQKYIYPSIKEHDIFFCYNNGIINIPYNSITSIFFDDIMKIGPINDIKKKPTNGIPKYKYQFLKYSPNFKRFLKESYKQFLESKEYKKIVLEDSKLNKMYTVYEMKDVNNYIKDRLIERTYYDILQSIRTKISTLLDDERKRIEDNRDNDGIIPQKGGAEPKYEGEFKLKLSLREKVTCELEMKDKPRLYEVIGKKKNQFIIYDDNYTTIDLEQKLMTFNIKDEIVKKLLEYNPSINYKRLKYIVSNKYNLLQGNNKSSKKIFNDMIEIEENDDIKFYKCIKTDLEKKIKEHYNKYYKDSKKKSIEYFTSNMIEDIEDLINNNSKYTNIFNFNKTGFMIMHYLTNQYFTQHIDKDFKDTDEYDISSINIYDKDTEYFNSINNINELKHYIKKLKLLVIKLENETKNNNISKKIKELEDSIDNYKKNKIYTKIVVILFDIESKINKEYNSLLLDIQNKIKDIKNNAIKIAVNIRNNIFKITVIKNTKKNITHNKKLLTGYHTKIHMGINMLDGWNDLLQDDTTLNRSKYLWLYDNIEKINMHIENYNNNIDITDLDNKIKTLNKEILELNKKVYHYNILHKRAEKIHNTITDNYILPEDMLRAVEYDNVNKNIKFMKAKSEKEKVKIMRDEYKDKLDKYTKELNKKNRELNDKNKEKKKKEYYKKYSKAELNKIKDKFEKLHNRGRMYFEDSPFYLQNKAKCFLYELLNYVVQLVIGNNMKTYLLRILYHNRSKEDTKDIENIFDSYKVFDKYSLIEHLQAQSMDMIKSSIDLFENETEKENYEKKSISNIIEDAIDTFILERNNDTKYGFFIIDGNIVKSLEKSKKILGEYFESFIPQYIKNLVAVYENNMKFVINHYRLLDMYIKSID